MGLKYKDKTYYVIATHLISKRRNNDAKRYAQAHAIRRTLLTQESHYHHYVILGDLNDTSNSLQLR
jgi:endonuclease/exonuclease/phosphatase family metal-dependent hydrolase